VTEVYALLLAKISSSPSNWGEKRFFFKQQQSEWFDYNWRASFDLPVLLPKKQAKNESFTLHCSITRYTVNATRFRNNLNDFFSRSSLMEKTDPFTQLFHARCFLKVRDAHHHYFELRSIFRVNHPWKALRMIKWDKGRY